MKSAIFKLAREESFKSTYCHKIGAVLVKGNRVLSKGFNQIRHLGRGKKFTAWDCSVHAERFVLSQVKKEQIVGADIYIYRETKDGIPAMAFPCENCLHMLEEMGIKQIFYSTPTFPFWEKLKL